MIRSRGGGAASRPFGPGLSVVQDPLNKGHFFAEGNHSREFLEYWKDLSSYTDPPHSESGLVFVSAKDVEGIYLNSDEVKDPAVFWGRWTGGTQESFVQIAQQIPQVSTLLGQGYSLDQICSAYPSLESCVDIYYRSAPSVKKLGEFYVFVDNGRHRTLAAQAANGKIPVKVIGTIRHR